MLTAAIGLTALAFLLFLANRLAKDVMLAWYLLLGASAIQMMFGNYQAIVAGIHLEALDVVSLALLVAGAMRFARRLGKPGLIRIVCLGYVAIYTYSLVRGIIDNGVLAASNESRGTVGNLVAMLYFTTVPTDEETLRKLVKSYLVFGTMLVVTAMLHYAGLDVGVPKEFIDELGKNRALDAEAAEVIALCFFLNLGWIAHRKSSLWLRIMPPIFAGTVIVLQHRTVWNMLIAGCIILIFLDVRMLRKFGPAALITSAFAVALAIGIYGSNNGATNQLEDSATNSNTWIWRIDLWSSLIFDQDQTPQRVVLGTPAGTPLISYNSVSSVYELAPVHSQYVELYISTGIVGFLLFMIFLLQPLYSLVTRYRGNRIAVFPSSSTWFLVLVGVGVYGITYQMGSVSVVWLGVVQAILLPKTDDQFVEQVFLEQESTAPVHAT